jgi:AcrR family transcriptional regulator
MTAATGPRPTRKTTTRQGLQAAADRLFAERGFEATTVRDIADAAGVTERTFFRYFAGKEALILDDALGWLPVLLGLVRARPAGEDAVTALRRALLELVATLADDPWPAPLWLFSEGAPGPQIARSARGAFVRVETGLAEVIRERVEASDEGFAMETSYLADLLARVTLAVIRSALARSSQLRRDGRARPSTGTLITQAFSLVSLPPTRALRASGKQAEPGGSELQSHN